MCFSCIFSCGLQRGNLMQQFFVVIKQLCYFLITLHSICFIKDVDIWSFLLVAERLSRALPPTLLRMQHVYHITWLANNKSAATSNTHHRSQMRVVIWTPMRPSSSEVFFIWWFTSNHGECNCWVKQRAIQFMMTKTMTLSIHLRIIFWMLFLLIKMHHAVKKTRKVSQADWSILDQCEELIVAAATKAALSCECSAGVHPRSITRAQWQSGCRIRAARHFRLAYFRTKGDLIACNTEVAKPSFVNSDLHYIGFTTQGDYACAPTVYVLVDSAVHRENPDDDHMCANYHTPRYSTHFLAGSFVWR